MNENVFNQEVKVDRTMRNKDFGHISFVIWFTGLSGSGKSTLASNLEKKLHDIGVHTYLLDGDNTRNGINNDLDFSDAGRKENIRRIAEISKLMIDAGLVVLVSVISPFESDRKFASELIGRNDFIEVYVNCPISICETRDVKGLYKKARAGEIKNFTGISSLYEPPVNPDVLIETGLYTVDECLKILSRTIFEKKGINCP